MKRATRVTTRDRHTSNGLAFKWLCSRDRAYACDKHQDRLKNWLINGMDPNLQKQDTPCTTKTKRKYVDTGQHSSERPATIEKRPVGCSQRVGRKTPGREINKTGPDCQRGVVNYYRSTMWIWLHGWLVESTVEVSRKSYRYVRT